MSTRDFRSNQTKFLSMASRGEDVVLKSRECGSFRLIPVTHNDAVVPKRDIMAELEHALTEVKEHIEGKRKLDTIETLLDEL